MSYLALYRKYRPVDFNSVYGQEEVVTVLKNAIIARSNIKNKTSIFPNLKKNFKLYHHFYYITLYNYRKEKTSVWKFYEPYFFGHSSLVVQVNLESLAILSPDLT